MYQGIFEQASQLWEMEAYTIKRLAEVVNPDAFSQTVRQMSDAVAKGGRVLAVGKGSSGVAAKKLVLSLCSADIPAIFLGAGDGKNATMGLLKSGDVLVLVSKGGSNQELVQLIEPARAKGVTVLGVTQNPASMMGMKCDLLLRIMVVKDVDTVDRAGHASSIALVAILDALGECISAQLSNAEA